MDKMPSAAEASDESLAAQAAAGSRAAFEELVGNHGGLGGEQTRPFILFPAEWELGEEQLLGAETVYKILKRWTAAAQVTSSS